jgi:peptidoglycan/LPS O-acetylase OafA/YrhL
VRPTIPNFHFSISNLHFAIFNSLSPPPLKSQILKSELPGGDTPDLALAYRGHIPALDALRGVAILLVLLVHFYREQPISETYPLIGPIITKLALAGVYGVELFFVLSGFLITGILLDSRNSPNYFRTFYVRRFLRIFPLYYGTLCVLFLLLPRFVDFDAPARDIASRQGWLWGYLANAPWSGGGWNNSSLFRLVHFWSLCVEEHFYIVWPLFVFLFSPKSLVRLCVTCVATCIIVRVAHSLVVGFPFLGWSSVTRLDGLAVGSLLAITIRQSSGRAWLDQKLPTLLVLSGALFTASIFVPRRLALGWYWGITETISVLFFGSLLVMALRHKGWFGTLMRNGLLRSLGKYSYGIYVIHYVCLPSFERMFRPQAISSALGSPLLGQVAYYALAFSASFLLALGSWHLIEKRFLKLKRLFVYESSPAPLPASTPRLRTST